MKPLFTIAFSVLFNISYSPVLTLLMRFNKSAFSCMILMNHISMLLSAFSGTFGVLSHGLFIRQSFFDRLVSYFDVDWVGYPQTRRSNSSFFLYLGDNLVSWSFKRQHVVLCSSADVEYYVVTNVVVEAF